MWLESQTVFDEIESVEETEDGSSYQHFLLFPLFSKGFILRVINPLPHMPILGSSNSAANKDMMSKLLTKGDLVQFSDCVQNIVGNVFKRCLLLMC